MSDFVGRLPLPPTANDVMVWDGTEFRPSKSVAINPIMAAISATALALAIGTGISDANRIGFLPSTAVPGSESVTLYVGGNAGPTWTARSGVVDLTMPDGGNFAYGTGTGTQHGTSTSQKQSFYGATPIVQPTGTTDLRTALINLGLYASGGASPLNLNGGAFTAASVTVSGLTSGRIPFATTAGLLTDSSVLTVAGGTVTATSYVAGDGTGSPFVRLNGVTGSGRYVQWQTAASLRWRAGASSSAESGADAGSPWVLEAFQDDGVTSLGQIINCQRPAGGGVLFTRPLQPGSGTAGAPSYAFSTDTTSGFFRASAGTISHVGAGVEYLRAGTAQFTYSRNASVLLGTTPITNVGTVTVHGVDAAGSTLALCGYGGVGGIIARRASGTASALTASASGDSIFLIQVVGYEATTPGFTSNRSAYTIDAAEAYTSAAQGTRHRWFTVPVTTTTAAEKMRLESSGNLLLGTTTDGLTAAGSLAIAQDFAHRGTKIGLFNTSPIVQKTGYGTPTGNAYQASFAAGSITLPNLAAAVAQLILDLKAYGQIGT